MDMKEEMKGEVLIIILEGELMGGEESKRLQERITQAIQDETISIVVDMTGVKWMNSSGLGMLMASLTTLRGAGGDMRLACLSDRVRRPIEVAKLDSVIKMYDSVDEAADNFGSEGG